VNFHSVVCSSGVVVVLNYYYIYIRDREQLIAIVL